MKIHAIKAGSMSVKCNYRNGKGKLRILRLTSVLLDQTFCEIPVYAWVVEHPEGLMVIDTGLTSQMMNPEYFPAPQRIYWETQYRFHITEEQEIGAQMQALGLSPTDVRWVLITHAHFDHTQALYTFPHSEIMFYRQEYEDATTYRSAHFDFPSKWPSWLKPRLIDYLPEPVGPFEQSFPITQAGDVRFVPTPGHTNTHQSVVVQDGGLTYFIAGDASFDVESLQQGIIDAPAMNSDQTLETRQKIIQLAQQTPLIYLPTHDPANEQRLAQRIPLMAEMPQQTRESEFS